MKLKIRTQPIVANPGNTCDVSFSVVVENADTGEVVPYVERVVLDMRVDDFATATITVSGVQVDSTIFVDAAACDITTRPSPECLQTNGEIVLSTARLS